MDQQKIALITGGSRGLGRNTAISLAKKGVGVVFTYHSREDAAREVVAEIEALGGKAVSMQLDSSNIALFPAFATSLKEQLLARWGRGNFDYLVNNAGIGTHTPISDFTEAEYDALMNLNVKGVFFLTQALLPIIADGGSIVNISSGLARFSMPNTSVYAMTKGAIEVFTRVLAKECGARGINVNTVAPGAVETDFGNGRLRSSPELQKIVAQFTALGRHGQADDIGPMIASLLSDANRWVNAQRIEVSGGMFI
jgi:NAD(P)-dependent dehydrogenase (short-subunit alcohol dehydrogenase family)